MNENEYYELLKNYAMDTHNYKGWRTIHTNAFGSIFSDAFSDSPEAQIHLTAALINISSRNFEAAIPKLDLLENFCFFDFDTAVLCYYKGLNYELMEDESKMTECYERLRELNVALPFPLVFHPYYRIAKLSHKSAECNKAYHYYRKALEFYDGCFADERIASTVSQITFELANVCLYKHDYDGCEHFLNVSQEYDSSPNMQRSYITAILRAIQGQGDTARKLACDMPPLLKSNCAPLVEAILAKKEPHYFAIPQNREMYSDFWNTFVKNASKLEKLAKNNTEEAEAAISNQLTKALPFMKRVLACRIEHNECHITVKCKTYCVKSLQSEYIVLFSTKPESLANWSFVAVDELESHYLQL